MNKKKIRIIIHLYPEFSHLSVIMNTTSKINIYMGK